MLRSLLIASLLYCGTLTAAAQTEQAPTLPAPIERRPPASVVLDPEWQQFAQRWNRQPGVEVRVLALGQPLHCHLDFISNEDLACVVYGRRSWFYSGPDTTYILPRKDVREVRISSHAASAFLGLAAGIGVAAIISRHNEGVFVAESTFFAPIGGAIGYQFTLKGRTLFRAR